MSSWHGLSIGTTYLMFLTKKWWTYCRSFHRYAIYGHVATNKQTGWKESGHTEGFYITDKNWMHSFELKLNGSQRLCNVVRSFMEWWLNYKGFTKHHEHSQIAHVCGVYSRTLDVILVTISTHLVTILTELSKIRTKKCGSFLQNISVFVCWYNHYVNNLESQLSQ